MADDDRLMDLLIRWEAMRSQGKLLTAEELCPDDETLRAALRLRLERRLRLGPFLQPPTVVPSPASPPPLPHIPGYEILGVRGHGGMGIVYQARQVQLDRPVALKMILSGALPNDRARFKVEAEAVARLQHPNIVQIFEVGEHGGRPYLVLEWVAGGSLAEHLGGTPLPARTAAELLLPLALAVASAHARGVVHRDLKPANILLQEERSPGRKDAKTDQEEKEEEQTLGSALRSSFAPLRPGERFSFIPKIADFGLAKRLDVDQGHTQTGAVLGTPSYMAPEQAAGRKDVGPATDIYALGAILYEALTGRPPFTGSTVLETLDQVRDHDPVPPSRLQPRVPHDLDVICLKCLRKEPADRYATAAALAADLQAYLGGEPIRARSWTALEQIVRAVRHHNLDERVAGLGNSYLWGAPVCTLIHLAAYALAHAWPRFPEVIALVTYATVVLLPLVALTARPDVMRLFPVWLRRRLWAVWVANVVASSLSLVLFWQATPGGEPERLLLVYPVWALLTGVAWFAFTDLLGIYYVLGGITLAAAVLAGLLPFWAPLIVSLAASLNMAVLGLFLRAVHQAVAQQGTKPSVDGRV
jgi:serine/threonine protein kinase